ncbi:rod-binding protein [uncultured Roseovarius sp.]|uniref:rod-binding protein n=1 Tax=uncultured Roseovarius sp. TaxID=293344 RepID=UPI002607FAD5|nr:rod-binding protein [uncultured Roseovarius sp.]
MTGSISSMTLKGIAETPDIRAMRNVAEKLEASFLAEMLKYGGLGTQENSLTESTSESQFASFHRDALAREMVSSGGIGLAEVFFRSLMERSHDI